jgi:hypothetical protein
VSEGATGNPVARPNRAMTARLVSPRSSNSNPPRGRYTVCLEPFPPSPAPGPPSAHGRSGADGRLRAGHDRRRGAARKGESRTPSALVLFARSAHPAGESPGRRNIQPLVPTEEPSGTARGNAAPSCEGDWNRGSGTRHLRLKSLVFRHQHAPRKPDPAAARPDGVGGHVIP